MLKPEDIRTLALLGILALSATAQESASDPGTAFASANRSVAEQLQLSLAELSELRQQIVEEQLPLSRHLSSLESELLDVRQEFQEASRLGDSRALELANLRKEIESRRSEAAYLSNLLGEYSREFEAQLHIAELPLYESTVERARLATENNSLEQGQLSQNLIELLNTSLDRLQSAVGGSRFRGTAVDAAGIVQPGRFAMIGPVALFRSENGEVVGTAEQKLGSLEPSCIAFSSAADSQAAGQLISEGFGTLPLDPTLGNAHKVEATEETLIEHIKKGGPVMLPILAMALAALLVSLFKWLSLAFLSKPSARRVEALLQGVRAGDEEEIVHQAAQIKGPVGQMLASGVQHIHEPRELIEEIMYEKVMTTRLRLERFLPFVAISAASAPLLGLLGTVTGIINTFQLITVFGSGDVKTLSGGISEALITTEFGLIVAIPALLIHAFLSRKVRGIVNRMETVAVAFMNQRARSPLQQTPPARSHEDLRRYAQDAVAELISPVSVGRLGVQQDSDGKNPTPRRDNLRTPVVGARP